MKTRAAVLRDVGKPFEIVELDLDEPKAGEVLIRFVASGLCHSDDHLRTGDIPVRYPIVGGHEGAGIVEKVGPGVTRLAVGDHVVTSWLPVCGHCRFCSRGQTNLCDLGRFLVDNSLPDGTYRYHEGSTDFGQMCLLGTFSQYAVVSQYSAVKIEEDFPLEVVALVGCGVPTGFGTAVKAGEVHPGDTTIVYGIGGVGINAVQGAAAAGARYVIAVDPVEFKRSTALTLGATHAVATAEEAHELALQLTYGVGADQSLITVGVVTEEVVSAAFAAVRKRGIVVVTAMGGALTDQGGARQRVRADRVREAAAGRAVRPRQPVRRHPADARAVPGGQAQARRADHHPLHPRPGQPGLRGHDGGPQHPRRHHPRALRRRRYGRGGARPRSGHCLSSRTVAGSSVPAARRRRARHRALRALVAVIRRAVPARRADHGGRPGLRDPADRRGPAPRGGAGRPGSVRVSGAGLTAPAALPAMRGG